MWFTCLAPFGLTALIQIFVLARQLNWYHETDTLMATALFWPTIAYLVIATIATAANLYGSWHFHNKAARATGNAAGSTLPVYDPVGRTVQAAAWRRRSTVLLVDSLFDLILIVCASLFVGFTINALNNALAEESYSFQNASWPLVAIWILLTLVALLASYRTSASKARASAPAADDEPVYRASAMQEKQAYMANANYQQWPCAFMFSWSLGYGWPDSVLAILLFAMLPTMIAVTLMFAHFLDTGAPSLATIFILPWILQGLILVFVVLTVVWMCCCALIKSSVPNGRAGRNYKAAELFAIGIITIFLVVQQIMLAVRVDEEDLIDWNVVFIPAYFLFAFITFANCSLGLCCLAKTTKTGDVMHDDENSTHHYTSYWGLIE